MTAPTIKEIISGSVKKPVIKKVWIATDSEVADAYNVAQGALTRAKNLRDLRPGDESEMAVAKAEQEAAEAEALMRENAICFTFKSLGRKEYEDLQNKYPPTKAQTIKAKADGNELPFNPDTFPAALISACCVEPEMSEAEARELLDSDQWNNAEIMSLWEVALEANTTRRLVTLGNA